MAFDLIEEMPSIPPAYFFALQTEIGYTKKAPSSKAMRASFSLPDTSELLGEERFATLALAWNEEGIFVEAFVDQPFAEAHFPHFFQGDALELFFDTRDLKNVAFTTRFSHHFLILPQVIQGIQAQEMTHFRTEDSHPLCDTSEWQIDTQFHKESYQLQLFIPASSLHGYEPSSFDRLGFTYRIHRSKGAPQHLTGSSSYFSIEQQPKLWATLKLSRKSP